MVILNNPADTNLLQASKFLLTFDRLPYSSYFCTKVNIPGINVQELNQDTLFQNAPIPGNRVRYEPLEITFLIDEPMWAWTTIQDWLKGISFPESFEQYRNLSLQKKLQISTDQPQYSDATLTVLSNKNNPILTVQFSLMFPISLGGINFDTGLDATHIITGTASFKYTNYDISRI